MHFIYCPDMNETKLRLIKPTADLTAEDRCSAHPAYWATYCPVCGTAREIGAGR